MHAIQVDTNPMVSKAYGLAKDYALQPDTCHVTCRTMHVEASYGLHCG